MNLGQLAWYRRRLEAMTPAEIGWRVHDQIRHLAWARRRVAPGACASTARRVGPGFPTVLPPDALAAVPPEAAAALVAEADRLLGGAGEVLGVRRSDLDAPDWFVDPVTGRRAPQGRYAFRIDHRSRAESGDVKQIWELSRHQHLTVLAGAWALTGRDDYARAVDRQLRSWWRENPFLSGIHWTSGIELGLRLVSWVWIRRLLDGWPGAPALFEDNPAAVQQVHWHQRYLSVFRSRGSSANNHVVAEAVGQLVASSAFPWFADSARWCRRAVVLFEHEILNNTFPDGFDREQASEYHGFVAELGLVAAVELAGARTPVSGPVWARLCRMVDDAAAVLDETGRAPRQGDSDDGRALVIDPPGVNRWHSLLALGSSLFAPACWWPAAPPGVTSTLAGALGGPRPVSAGRPVRRPSHFPDAGLTILRSTADEVEIWCRCDGGPHGFLALSGHAHADALSIEVRCGGVDILTDPGTYCYHGQPNWRGYFRSTVGHNTIELEGGDQSVSGGPFLWLRHANARVVDVDTDGEAGVVRWSAEHDGYVALVPPAVHRRSVALDRHRRRLDIVDRITSEVPRRLRMAFHLGPALALHLDGGCAELRWRTPEGSATAWLRLPDELAWSVHRGECHPPLGWYSDRFGVKEPASTLIGAGRTAPGRQELRSRLQFSP